MISPRSCWSSHVGVAWLVVVLVGTLWLSMLISPCHGSKHENSAAQECDANNNPDRQEAQIILNDELFILKDNESKFPKQSYSEKNTNDDDEHGDDDDDKLLSNYYYILREDKPVLYVPDFLNTTISQEIKNFCLQPENRFQRSPVRGKNLEDEDEDDEALEDGVGVYVNNKSELRTSESCALVPAALYLSKPNIVEMMNVPNPTPMVAQVKRQVDISWDIATRASNILGDDVSPTTVEPLQLVRYTSPIAQYKIHHDHGGYYKHDTERRLWTMLIFLNDLGSVDAGGHTSFPKLNLDVVPRAGDALIWSNVIRSTSSFSSSSSSTTSIAAEVDPDMVHAGKPPSIDGIEKYAVNVWFGEDLSVNRMKEGKWS